MSAVLHPAAPARGQLGIWVFIASELMLFGPLVLGYVYVRLHYPDALAAASRHTDFWLGTINTAVLLSSSLAVALAVELGEAGKRKAAARWLVAAASCGVAFLIIKGSEYAHDWQAHLFPGAGFHFPGVQADAAQMFFYLYFALTGLHALHLAVAIIAVLACAFVLSRKEQQPAPAALDVAGLYWHFVDVVWIFLYPILYLVGRNAG